MPPGSAILSRIWPPLAGRDYQQKSARAKPTFARLPRARTPSPRSKRPDSDTGRLRSRRTARTKSVSRQLDIQEEEPAVANRDGQRADCPSSNLDHVPPIG